MRWPLRTTRRISISCRGAEISERDLFDYTNGRFLNDEKCQLSKRRVEFNLSNLCNEAVSVANGSPVRKIEKMEGGFSKALVITMENGKEVVAKLPCPNAGRAMYSTASEAAVLQYVSTRTQVPVPKLLAWNADATNPVGAEYIIMEKAPGVQLYTVWDDLSATDRIKLIKSLTQLEHQLATIQFPAYGNLYFRQSIPEPSKRVLLDSFLDPTGQFCVGPSCDPAWTNGTTAADIDSTLDLGPWLNLYQYGMAHAKRSTTRTRLPVNNNVTSNLQGTAKDHIVLCDMALKLLPKLAGLSSLQQSARPTIWHTDLHMGNIFVSEQDHSQIVSFIDWQHISISPLFLQARWPVFLSPPDDYALGPRHPELSSDFENFGSHDKEVALFEKERADASKAYEIATYLNNRDAYVALWKIDQPVREFFKRIGDTWDDGMVPLEMCLLKICETWGQLGFSDPCPLDLSIRDVETFNQRSIKYKQWNGIQDFAKKYLNTDDDGWIAPQMDFNEKGLQNKALLDLLIERAQSEEEARETRRMWPFPT
ncbi:MAG: hypothetical protein L6R38_003686 [Xanthoria sp. 2 TBL-2021]|nr:MAG: hypothetical protein L6R38_003686 [Xanthoria sp. 2 TBL-2021]